MLVFWFVVASLANYGLAHAISQEEGPFRVFERFRNLFQADHWTGRGVHCILCVGTWTAFLLAFLLASNLREFVLVWLGMRGLTHIFHKYWMR